MSAYTGGRLQGKVALVTGAGSGIGRSIAFRLAAEGARVFAADRDMEGTQQTVDEIEGRGQIAAFVQSDVSGVEGCRHAVDACLKRFGRVDVLINNAGVTLWKSFFEVNEALWDAQIDTNLKSQFFLSQMVARDMAERGAGRIVNIGSVLGYGAMESVAPYGASKGGIAALTRGLALELGPLGITVNAVAPGPVDVPRNLRDDPEYAAHWAPLLPVRRVGHGEDVAAAVAFLVSEEAGFIAGQVLYVDGGLTAVLSRPDIPSE